MISTPFTLYEEHCMRLRIKDIIAHGSDPITGLCRPCSQRTSHEIEKLYSWYQYEIGSYGKENFKDLTANKELDSRLLGLEESKLKSQIQKTLSEVKLLEIKLSVLKNSSTDSMKALEAACHSCASLLEDINVMEAKRATLADKLQGALFASGAAERELRLLHAIDSIPLFSISVEGDLPSINGFGLSLYPNRTVGLEFSEINAAWGLVGCAVACILRLRSSGVSDDRHFDVGYKLTPLRNRVLLRRMKYSGNSVLGPVLNLEGNKSETYLEAIAALCVVISFLAKGMNRSNALVGVLGKVMSTIEKYGVDVAGSSFGNVFSGHSRKSSTKTANLGEPRLDLLPHWRFLFSASSEIARDVLSSIRNLQQ